MSIKMYKYADKHCNSDMKEVIHLVIQRINWKKQRNVFSAFFLIINVDSVKHRKVTYTNQGIRKDKL